MRPPPHEPCPQLWSGRGSCVRGSGLCTHGLRSQWLLPVPFPPCNLNITFVLLTESEKSPDSCAATLVQAGLNALVLSVQEILI